MACCLEQLVASATDWHEPLLLLLLCCLLPACVSYFWGMQAPVPIECLHKTPCAFFHIEFNIEIAKTGSGQQHRRESNRAIFIRAVTGRRLNSSGGSTSVASCRWTHYTCSSTRAPSRLVRLLLPINISTATSTLHLPRGRKPKMLAMIFSRVLFAFALCGGHAVYCIMCVCLCVLGNSLSLEMIESTEHFFLSDDWQQWALHHYRKDSDLVQQVGRSPAPRYCTHAAKLCHSILWKWKRKKDD